MLLRRAGAADSGVVRELASAFRAEGGRKLEAEEAAAIDELLSRTELGTVYLVMRDGETAGYVALCFGFSLEHGGRDAFIDEFYLVPGARNAGVGTKTLTLVEREAAQAGVRTLHLEVLKDNARVRGLYARAGYRDRGLLVSRRLDRA